MTRARSIGELPGPRGLPLFGSAHQLLRASRAHLKAEAWARRYGPIVRVDIGPRRIVGISDRMTARRLAMPIPYWRWVRLPADRALDRSLVEIRKAVIGFIEQARTRMAARPELHHAPENFLEGMLAAQQADSTFTDEEIISNVSTLLNADEDTTAHTLAWTVWFLASRPEIQLRLAQEAHAVMGNDALPTDHAMIERLPFCEAVIRESMRLKTVGPLLTLEPLVDTTICDTHIPAGTRLLLLLRQAGLHDGQGASEFHPERWLGEDNDESAPKSLAFGAGPRFCPDRNLAFLESKAAIAMIARNFTIELDDSKGAVEEAFHFAMVPKGLRVRLCRGAPK